MKMIYRFMSTIIRLISIFALLKNGGVAQLVRAQDS